MCNPIVAAMAAATAMESIGVYQQASMEKYTAKQNARIASAQAADAIARGDDEAAKVRREALDMQSTQRASYAGQGVDVGTGTAAHVQQQTEYFGEWDAATVRNNARKESWALRSQAENFRAQASSINPLMRAGGTLLSGAAKTGAMWKMGKA